MNSYSHDVMHMAARLQLDRQKQILITRVQQNMPPIIEPAVYRALVQLGAGHPFSLQEPQLDNVYQYIIVL